MDLVQALLTLAAFVALIVIALLLHSMETQQREEREAAANRHRELMRCFHTIRRQGDPL